MCTFIISVISAAPVTRLAPDLSPSTLLPATVNENSRFATTPVIIHIRLAPDHDGEKKLQHQQAETKLKLQ